MLTILPRRAGGHGVVVDTTTLNPRFLRPEQLNRVTLTEVIRRVARLLLVRTNDDMHLLRAVAVIDDGIIADLDTYPFALPLMHFLAVRVEGRMHGVTQDDRILLDRLLAEEDRISSVEIEVR